MTHIGTHISECAQQHRFEMYANQYWIGSPSQVYQEKM